MKDITRFNLLPGVTNTTKTLVQNLINVDLNNRDAYFNNRRWFVNILYNLLTDESTI